MVTVCHAIIHYPCSLYSLLLSICYKIDINGRKARGVLFWLPTFVALSVQMPDFWCQIWNPILEKNRDLDRWSNEAKFRKPMAAQRSGNQKRMLLWPCLAIIKKLNMRFWTSPPQNLELSSKITKVLWEIGGCASGLKMEAKLVTDGCPLAKNQMIVGHRIWTQNVIKPRQSGQSFPGKTDYFAIPCCYPTSRTFRQVWLMVNQPEFQLPGPVTFFWFKMQKCL